jgi:3-hydroxyisobutyrate dehydrogenase-like beta-hydroxyacid dehydrogenase
MTPKNIGILHPGEMGISVAAAARHDGNTVYWFSEGRSQATRERAAAHSLCELETLVELCARCGIIISICPPHAAEQVAGQVAAAHFQGVYCDANAIAPQRMRRIGELLNSHGIAVVDGGIIGGPAWEPGQTWLYLSGERAPDIADLFDGSPFETSVISDCIGSASALKMCYAAFTKGTTALLAAVLGAAEELSVRQELYAQWSRDDKEFVTATEKRVRNSTRKAWRFEGEMREIAATFESAGMPGGFHQAAAEIYARLAALRDAQALPPLAQVLDRLVHEPD